MTEVVLWVAADGSETVLDVEWNVRGRFSPPAVFDAQGIPGEPGERVWDVRHGVMQFDLPFWVEADTESQLRAEMRATVARMDPRRGPGRLRVVAPAGDAREIYCHVAGGLGMDEVLGQSSGPQSQLVPAVIRAYDPYWWAVDDTVLDYPGGGVVATFFPFFAVRLSASEVFADTDVTNDGDVTTWPVWQLTGPFTDVTAENLTTAQQWALTAAATSLDTITVDTRVGAKTVVRSDGANLFGSLSAASQLWPFTPGLNHIRISMGGSTAASNVRLILRPRYLSP